jgi:hypothetical protein
MGRANSTHGRYQKCVRNLLGKPETRLYEDLSVYFEDNIRMDLKETDVCGLDLSGSMAGSCE